MLQYYLPGLIFGLVAALSFQRGKSVISWLIGVVIFLVNVYLSWQFLPVYAYGFVGLPILLVLNGVVILILAAADEDIVGWISGGVATGVGVIFLFVVPFFAVNGLFHAAEYRNMITVEPGVFSTDTAPLSNEHIRRVDRDMAEKIADKMIGEIPGLGSSEKVGKMHIQSIRGELYWVAPLRHSGFFKWMANSAAGTHGYVAVSVVDENDKRLVTSLGGEPLHLRYIEGGCWSQNPARYLYEHGYSSVPITDYTFELNDEWRPYIVATRYAKRIGYAGNDAVGVVLIDVQTGAITEKSIADAPKWIDRIQPENFIANQLDDWGSYVKGYWNTWFFRANTDMMQIPSDESSLIGEKKLSLVYGKDGRCYWYASMTSHGSDESISGFVLVDSRTKKAKIYMQSGATETAAMSSANGLFQAQKYKASQPILYNIGGLPTYFMSMKDGAGQIKGLAFVSVKDYNIVGGGPDLYTALESYQQRLSNAHEKLAPEAAVRHYVVTDVVYRKEKREAQDGTLYYVVLANHLNKLFVGPMTLSSELIVTEPGDTVTITYKDGGNEMVSMTGFDNSRFQFQKTKEQIGVEERAEKAKVRDEVGREAQNAEAVWQNLTPAQKAELMKKK